MSKKLFSKVFILLLVVGLLFAVAPTKQAEAQTGTTIQVGVLDPSWTAPGGGGVYAAYYGPANGYAPVVPGSTAIFDGREAGIIKAGINIDTDGHYWDEGILAFKVNNVPTSTFATQALSYEVQNETGTNPVWVRIRIVGGTTFQHVPASYGVGGGYHLIDAAAGSWQLMDSNGNATGPFMTLAELATAYPTAEVDRVYLTLGMGDSYNVSPGVGTVGWVDKVVIDTETYDFVVIPSTLCTTDCYVDAVAGNDTFPGTTDFPVKTIQKGIDYVSASGTVHVAAGDYGVPATINLDKAISIIGPTTGEAKVIGTGTDMFKVFAITSSNVTIKDLEITLAVTPAYPLLISDELDSSLISISGGAGLTGIIIQGNEIYVPVQTPPMTRWTARALTVGSNTVSGMVISGNTVYNTRNGIVIQGNNSATITGNTIYNTKGGIMNYTGTAEDAAARVMTNNSWGTVHNEWDIVWNSGGGPYDLDENVLVLGISQSNNDAYVVSLMPTAYNPPQLLYSNRSHVFVNATTGTETIHNANGNINVPYKKIQDGINAVVPGGKVIVAAGTYAEDVLIDKSLTILGPNSDISPVTGTRVPEAVVKSFRTQYSEPQTGITIKGFEITGQVLSSSSLAGIYVGNTQNVTIEHNYIHNVQGHGIAHFGTPITNLNILDNKLINTGVGNNSGVYLGFLTDAVISANLIDTTAYGGILLTADSTGVDVVGNTISNTAGVGIQISSGLGDIDVSGNIISNAGNGLNEADKGGIRIYGSGLTGLVSVYDNTISGSQNGIGIKDSTSCDLSYLDIYHNSIATTNEVQAYNGCEDGSVLDATENWWGSIAGPAAGTLVGTAEYAPWCGDAECSFLVYLAGSDLQASIDATPAGGTLYVPDLGPDSNYTVSYTVGGKTLILGEGVTIQANSPCFTVTGDNTIITAETIGEARCVLSDTYGIEVNAGLKNVVIEGIYFDADAAVGLADILSVINFNGAIEDVLINDNHFHYAGTSQIGTFLYDGILFAQQPTGVVEIKGNLFDMQNIYGCAVNNPNGTSTIDAQFNSFGSMAGHPTDRDCTTLVDYSNFTHADVYLESSATPWANQEVVGQEFTLTVKANLTKVTGAKFTLKYNPALVDLDAASLENLSGFSAAGLNMFEVDETHGLITFNANAYSAITGAEYALFSAKFTASAVGAALFEVDALSDEFAMFPGYASSSNVYGYTLLPVSVDLIELPTVASTFGDSYYLVGEAREFTITVTNHDTVYAFPELRITIPAGLTLKYGSTDYTGSLVVDLADLAVGEEVVIGLTATFTTPFNTTAAVLDVDLVDKLTPEELLVEASFSAFAYTKPTVTIETDPYFLVGVPGDFSVTIDNPPTGRNYGDTIVFDIVIANHAVADISAVSCTMGTQTWDLIGELEQDDTDVVARIEGLTGGFFTVPANFTAPISCSITYATPGTYAVSGYMVEGISSPERIVSDSYSATTQVYIQPVITSTDLDGPFQAGLAQGVTLTITNPSPIPEPFDLVFTLPDGTTILYNGVTYTCDSTGCPPIPLVAGAVPGDIDFTITFPVEYTAGTADVSVSLYDRDTVGAPSPLATLSMEDVVVYANVASVTGTVSMQGRTTRAGVLVTLAGSFDTYTATSINTLSDNVSFTNLASGVYAITVEQARYLDITIAHGATIDLAELQAIANLMLRAGDANDDNSIDGGDASIVGTQYGTGTIADQGDINFDNKVNIQDLALVGGNFDLQSADPNHLTKPYAYGSWMK